MSEKNEIPVIRENPYDEPHDYHQNTRTDLMKGLQCVAFLLEWCTQAGNEKIDGWAAHGLSVILRHAADEAEGLYTFDELGDAGGNPLNLERHKRARAVAAQERGAQ